jgi:hypothetical protein
MVGVELLARNKGISGILPTMQAVEATYRHGVEGSYNLVTPVLSIGQLIGGSFSSSKVLKKTRW